MENCWISAVLLMAFLLSFVKDVVGLFCSAGPVESLVLVGLRQESRIHRLTASSAPLEFNRQSRCTVYQPRTHQALMRSILLYV